MSGAIAIDPQGPIWDSSAVVPDDLIVPPGSLLLSIGQKAPIAPRLTILPLWASFILFLRICPTAAG